MIQPHRDTKLKIEAVNTVRPIHKKSRFCADYYQRGLESVEFSILTALTVVGLVILVSTFLKYPNYLDKAVFVVIGGIFAGAIAGSVGMTFRNLDNRTQLSIMEILSDGKVRTRKELLGKVKRKSFVYFIIPNILDDSLAKLVQNKQVSIINGNYSMIQPTLSTKTR